MSSVLPQRRNSVTAMNDVSIGSTPLSTPVSGIMSAMTEIFRKLEGKRPVSPVRDAVKEVLRVFGDQARWSEIPNLSVSARAALEMIKNEKVLPLTQTYAFILRIYGIELSERISTSMATVLPSNIPELETFKEEMMTHRRLLQTVNMPITQSLKSLILPEPANIEASKKIKSLFEQATAGAKSFYDNKIKDINAAMSIVRKTEMAAARATRRGGKRTKTRKNRK